MTKAIFISLVTLLLPWSLSYATKGAHGGVVVVCRADQGQIRSVELLDFWEWNRLVHPETSLQIQNVNLSHKEQIQNALEKVSAANPDLGEALALAYQTVSKVFRRLPGDVKLPDLTDTDPVYQPKDCFLEQLAIYDINPLTGEEFLSVEPEIFSLLNETQKAAFFLHETVYKVYRQNYGSFIYDRDGVDFKIGDTSRMTRFFVGALFSSLEFSAVPLQDQPNAVQCSGKYFDFTLDGDRLSLTRVGIPLVSQALGKLERAGLVQIQTAFNPLGGKLNLHISSSGTPNEYIVKSTGAMLNVREDRVTCTQNQNIYSENSK